MQVILARGDGFGIRADALCDHVPKPITCIADYADEQPGPYSTERDRFQKAVDRRDEGDRNKEFAGCS